MSEAQNLIAYVAETNPGKDIAELLAADVLALHRQIEAYQHVIERHKVREAYGLALVKHLSTDGYHRTAKQGRPNWPAKPALPDVICDEWIQTGREQ